MVDESIPYNLCSATPEEAEILKKDPQLDFT